MENSRNGKTIAVIALVVAVLCLSVGFATISATLTINGTADIKGSKDTLWKVTFQNLGPNTSAAGGDTDPIAMLHGDAKEVTGPSITSAGTQIGTYAVTLAKPGDYVYYDFEIKNEGDLDAEISAVSLGNKSCTGDEKATEVCNSLKYTLTYVSDSEYQDNALAVGQTLASKATKKARLKLEYSTDMTAENLPKSEVTVSGLGVTVTYKQKGSK